MKFRTKSIKSNCCHVI